MQPHSIGMILLFLVLTTWNVGEAAAQVSAVQKQDAAEADSKDSAKLPSAQPHFGVEKTANLRFREPSPEDSGSAGTCDVFLPKPISGGTIESDRKWPVILVVHGGGWAAGDKWTMDRHARQLTQNGFAAVSINYRLAPTYQFPEQVDDVRSALVWITDHAEQYAFDLNHVGLYGYSAGGHLVSLVATLADEPWERVEKTTSWPQDDPRWKKIPKIGAVCIGGPPTDFRRLPPDNTALAYFLGGSRRERPEIYAAASPICFTSPQDPPFEIIHGEADGLVPISNAKEFHQALLAANVDASMKTLPKKGHFLAFISPNLSKWMVDFFEKHLANE